jgi:hypothetical protein
MTATGTLKTRFRISNGRPFSPRALFADYSSPPYPSRFDPADIRRSQMFTQCMRTHGVHAFPNPTAQFDAYGFFGKAAIDARRDPDFKTAQRVCARTVFGLSPPSGG